MPDLSGIQKALILLDGRYGWRYASLRVISCPVFTGMTSLDFMRVLFQKLLYHGPLKGYKQL